MRPRTQNLSRAACVCAVPSRVAGCWRRHGQRSGLTSRGCVPCSELSSHFCLRHELSFFCTGAIAFVTRSRCSQAADGQKRLWCRRWRRRAHAHARAAARAHDARVPIGYSAQVASGARASRAAALGGCERHRRRVAPAGGRVGARREADGTGYDACLCALQPRWQSSEAGGTTVAASRLSECRESRRHRAALRLATQIGPRLSLRRHRPEGRLGLEDELDHEGLRAAPPSAPFRARPPRAWGDCA
jgi:hypothetical protein